MQLDKIEVIFQKDKLFKHIQRHYNWFFFLVEFELSLVI
jgi:hypothetical protein